MKKFTMIAILTIVAACMSLQAQTIRGLDPSLDPTGHLGVVYDMAASCATKDEINAYLSTIELDMHPDHGYVGANEHPVSDGGWTTDSLGKDVADGATEIRTAKFEFTGIALAEHRIGDETVYVWHEYDQAPVVAIVAQEPSSGATESAFRLFGCGNYVVLDWQFDWYTIGQILGRW